MRDQITPLVLTFNEAPNISRCLERLTWAKEIVVVDSFSTDDTVELARKFANVRIVQRKFDLHAGQWNYGVEQVLTPWVLSLDADYVTTQELEAELNTLLPGEVSAYFASIRYCVFGKPLRGSLYPARAVLFRKDRCRYVQDGHTQRLHVNGPTARLHSVIDHDDRKSLSHWLSAQDRYATLEVEKLLAARAKDLAFQDRIRRKIVLAPLLVCFYTLVCKGLILDGWPGWYYVFQRVLAETILSLKLIERKLKGRA